MDKKARNREYMRKHRERNPWYYMARRLAVKDDPEYKEHRRKQAKDWYYSDKGKAWKRRSTISAYGLLEFEYDAMLHSQGYKCAICPRSVWLEKGGVFHVDHDHDSGSVRGLLCGQCNVGLGMFCDDVSRMTAAIKYLENSGG